MSANTPEARAFGRAQLAALLIPHREGGAGERDGALNAVPTAIDASRGERLRHAARSCRWLARMAGDQGDAAIAPAESIRQMAVRADARAVQAARRWQDEP